MKMERILIATMVTGILTFSCNNTESDTETSTESAPETEVNEEMPAEEETETIVTEVEVIELGDKVYAVEEFVGTYETDEDAIIDQTVTVKGYYMNHNKQKAANTDDEYTYNVTLYKDETFERKGDQVFIKMKANDASEFEGIKQKDKIVVKGVISGDEFFGAPMLVEGEVVK